MLLRLVTAIVSAALALGATDGAEDLRKIRSLELDPERCYRVRDVYLEREDVKLYFTDGHLIFAKPVLGRTIAALFLATSQTDVGEVLVIPPLPSERQSMARFLDETILNEKFRNAMMFFTDDTPAALDAAIKNSAAHSLDAEAGARIAPRWSFVLRNLLEGSALRVLTDLYSEQTSPAGFFAAAVRGNTLGRFDVVVDHTLPEQVVAGQLVRSQGRDYYEVWSRFEGRSVRSGLRQVQPQPARLEDYRIATRLGADLHMQVKAEATLALEEPAARALSFEISDKLALSAVTVAGEPVEFLQQSQTVPRHRRSADDALAVVLLPDSLASAGRYPIEFEYAGKVVSDAGSGVYYVGDRGNWYPRVGWDYSNFELTFRYPANLDLVATGERVEHVTDGGMKTSRFVSGKPIRLAGFNLGNYVSASRAVEGYRVEVRATKSVERRLQPSRTPVIMPAPVLPGRRRRQVAPPVVVLPQPPTADPSEDIDRISDESADAFRYFLGLFGEPAMPVTVVSPVPGGFGQGFPGLVYASTLSYFERGDRPLRDLSGNAQRFFADLMRPHEIAHQWWGNVVTSQMDRDAWIMEGLATYSSLLWIEQRKGVAERNEALAAFRQNLLRRVDGKTVESAGPIILGRRLRTSKLPEAYRVIVYEKGAWIMHMLRGIIGDESFFAMLRQLCDQRAGEPVTTEQFKALAARYVPDGYVDAGLRDFFDQWVHGTGIPRLAVEWDQTASGGRHRFEMSITQTGVPEYFPLQVPVEVHTLPGRSLVKTVSVGDGADPSSVSIVLRNPASRVAIDPQASLLAETP